MKVTIRELKTIIREAFELADYPESGETVAWGKWLELMQRMSKGSPQYRLRDEQLVLRDQMQEANLPPPSTRGEKLQGENVLDALILIMDYAYVSIDEGAELFDHVKASKYHMTGKQLLGNLITGGWFRHVGDNPDGEKLWGLSEWAEGQVYDALFWTPGWEDRAVDIITKFGIRPDGSPFKPGKSVRE